MILTQAWELMLYEDMHPSPQRDKESHGLSPVVSLSPPSKKFSVAGNSLHRRAHFTNAGGVSHGHGHVRLRVSMHVRARVWPWAHLWRLNSIRPFHLRFVCLPRLYIFHFFLSSLHHVNKSVLLDLCTCGSPYPSVWAHMCVFIHKHILEGKTLQLHWVCLTQPSERIKDTFN